MARKAARMELNFAALDKVQQAVAMGALAFLERIAHDASANAPVSDDPRYGHVKDQWGVAVWAFGKKVGDVSADGTAVAKPRAFRTDKLGIVGIVGFGFPGRFAEVGTSDTRAQPFLSPAGARSASYAQEAVAAGARPHWPKAG